jgi:D-amino-acid dehydrogenase
MRWMAEFLSNIPHYKRNTVETVRLAIAARAVLFEMAAREGIDFDLERRGILHFYSHRRTSPMPAWSTACSPRAASSGAS